MPEGASGFTTIELKTNHLGKNTQVWDATVTHKTTGKAIALFRCTQIVLYLKAKA